MQTTMRDFRDSGSVRSIFISDVHLGCRHSQAGPLLEFLERFQPEYLYLVGDIIDGRSLKRRWCWFPEFTSVLTCLLEMAAQGTVVRYTIGNHDEFLRDSSVLAELKSLEAIEISEEFVHITNDDKKFLVIHGDRFDHVEQSAEWVSQVASVAYESLLSANQIWSRCTGSGHRGEYTLSSRIKRAVKHVVKYISEFEHKVVHYAKKVGCHGVICGHIHTPVVTEISGLKYCNTGDWVENCSALIEWQDGQLELLYFDEWHRPVRKKPQEQTARVKLTSRERPQLTPFSVQSSLMTESLNGSVGKGFS